MFWVCVFQFVEVFAKWRGLCKNLTSNGNVWALNCCSDYSGLADTVFGVITLHSLCSVRDTTVSFHILTHRHLERSLEHTRPLLTVYFAISFSCDTRIPPLPGSRLATSWVPYTTSCKHSLVLLKMGEIIARNMSSWLRITNKPLSLHLVGCLYYLFQWYMVK
jgi:hypothetical protein